MSFHFPLNTREPEFIKTYKKNIHVIIALAAYGLGGSSFTLSFLVIHQALFGYED